MASSILLIESDERSGSDLESALVGAGYTVRWTRSGEAGLSALSEERPALIVLSVELPGVSGYSV